MASERFWSPTTSSGSQSPFPNRFPRRGEIYEVDFGERQGSEQECQRPCIIVSNIVNNQHGSVVLVAPMTTNLARAQYPQNSLVKGGRALPKDSVVLGEQVTVVSKSRLSRYRGELGSADIADLNRALRVIFDL